jgi:hypothetical protein
MTWGSQQGSLRSLSNSSLSPLYMLGPRFFQNKFTLLVISIKSKIYPWFSAFHATANLFFIGTVARPFINLYPLSLSTRPTSM